MFDTPSFDDSLESFTLGNSQNVTVLVLFENRVNSDLFFEKVVGEVDFLGDGSSVNLDLNNVVLLLSKVKEFHLGSGNHSDN
jgi:hypothetical protein